jgi:hypothetical protein
MAAVEKWAGIGGRQLFSGRTKIHGFLALKSDYRFQPLAAVAIRLFSMPISADLSWVPVA